MVKNLRLLREEKGFSQQKLADMLSTSQQTIFKYEKTDCEPDIATLIKLAAVFNVSVDFLIGNSEIRETNVKRGAVMLTDSEKKHIELWRSLPDDIKENAENLLKNIIK